MNAFARGRRVPLLLLGLTAIGLAWQTWAMWGSIRIDCGREVYVPTVLLGGGTLYADAWYPYGPLPPYLQAALLAVFGVRLEALYALGLALTLGFAWLLYDLGRRFTDQVAGFVVAWVFLTQAFLPELFNFVLPYSYAAPLGALLGLAVVRLLVHYTDSGRPRALVWAGIVSGLTLLSKQEFGVAATLVVIAVLAWPVARPRSGDLVSELARYLPGLLPAFLVYGYYFLKLTPEFVLLENFQTHPGSVFFRAFGRKWVEDRGLRFQTEDLVRTALVAATSLAGWWCFARVGQWLRQSLALLTAALLALVILFTWPAPYGWPATWPSPSAMAVFPVGLLWFSAGLLVQQLARTLRRSPASPPDIALLAVALYASVTGVRIMVRVSPHGYGLYYAFPLFLVFVYWVHKVTRHAAGPASRAPVVALLLIALGCARIGQLRTRRLAANKLPFESSIGRIHAARGDLPALREAVAFLQSQPRESRRVLIAPDEVFLYSFAGLKAPSRWYQLTPGVLDVPDEERLIAAAEAAGVRYVLVSNRYSGEYGVSFFGIDYSRRLQAWIDTRFVPTREFGSFRRIPVPPERTAAPLAFQLYERRETAAGSVSVAR